MHIRNLLSSMVPQEGKRLELLFIQTTNIICRGDNKEMDIKNPHKNKIKVKMDCLSIYLCHTHTWIMTSNNLELLNIC